MKLLDRILHRASTESMAESAAEPGSRSECPHVALVPAWDNAADIGNEAKASRYSCGACGSTFTPGEARELRATEAERIRLSRN